MNCANPNCKEKELHPVTLRSYDGCCSPLCEEIVDHERTCDILEGVQKELAEAKAEVKKLRDVIAEHKTLKWGWPICSQDEKLWEVLK